MASLLSDPCFFLHRPLIPESKAGKDWNSRCLGFPLACQRSGLYKKHPRVKFRVEVKASSGGNVLVDEMASVPTVKHDFGVVDIHHVGVLCENLEKSLEFYQNLLGLDINEARPHHKLPYRGAWLWVGSGMIHLMELPNPDPLSGRPEHGGRDRHTCISIRDVSKLKTIFDDAGIKYTLSKSGRPAIFARDPDGNALEFTQVQCTTIDLQRHPCL